MPIIAQIRSADSRVLLGLSVGVGLLRVLATAFEWTLIGWLTVFLAPLLSLAIWILFALVCTASLIHALRGRVPLRRRMLPLGISSAVLLLVLWVPWTPIWLDLNFRLYRSDRMQVVTQVQSGTLRPNVSYNPTLISLPRGLRHVSKGGGEVVVQHYAGGMEVLFFTFRGILDNYAGFVYRSDGSSPRGEMEEYREVERLTEHWYWVSSS